MTFNYPNYVPNYGNLTEKIMKEFILNYYHKEALDNKEITSLIAANDITKPLYFCQLYSILGEVYIEDLIRLFYTKLFKDNKNKWFSDEFIEIGSMEYHVKGQKKFWLDIMGGGEYYTGGEKKLHNYHKLVKNIMTNEGATLWMKHMNDALDEMTYNKDLRVRKCIDVFLKYFMTKYAIEFDFNFFSIMKTKL